MTHFRAVTRLRLELKKGSHSAQRPFLNHPKVFAMGSDHAEVSAKHFDIAILSNERMSKRRDKAL